MADRSTFGTLTNIAPAVCAVHPVDAADWPLEIWPDHGSMMGGDVVYFTGPCILPTNAHEYRCRFGDDFEQEGEEVLPAEAEDMPVGKCVVPRLDTLGQVTLTVSTVEEQPEAHAQSWPHKYHASKSHAPIRPWPKFCLS